MAEASYVGNRGTRLGVSRNINATPGAVPQHVASCATRPPSTYLGAAVPEPVLRPESAVHQHHHRPRADAAAVSAVRQHHVPAIRSATRGITRCSRACEKRFAHGFTLQVSYTWSKAMEATTSSMRADPMPYESLADIDRAHRIDGQRHLGAAVRQGPPLRLRTCREPLDFLAGGWQLSGAMQRQSGQPIDWGQMIIVGDSTKIALPSDQRNADRWFNTSVFSTNSARRPAGVATSAPSRCASRTSGSIRSAAGTSR